MVKINGVPHHRLRVYRTWDAMRQRCLNPKCERYPRYGGRGIRICPEWDDPVTFIQWALANGYRDDLTIDRIDNNGDYKPSNCCFIPQSEQMKKTSKVKLVTFDGKTQSLADWARTAGIRPQVLGHRLYTLGWPFEKAVTTPLRVNA